MQNYRFQYTPQYGAPLQSHADRPQYIGQSATANAGKKAYQRTGSNSKTNDPFHNVWVGRALAKANN